VLRWPDAREVTEAARIWAQRTAQERPEVVKIGYFGSYARGDWGVGSDLDVLILVEWAEEPFERRAQGLRTEELPVPADVWVYTVEEWKRLFQQTGFPQTIAAEIVWVFERRQLGT
jgi:predicted nucleotidyltransferase